MLDFHVDGLTARTEVAVAFKDIYKAQNLNFTEIWSDAMIAQIKENTYRFNLHAYFDFLNHNSSFFMGCLVWYYFHSWMINQQNNQKNNNNSNVRIVLELLIAVLLIIFGLYPGTYNESFFKNAKFIVQNQYIANHTYVFAAGFT